MRKVGFEHDIVRANRLDVVSKVATLEPEGGVNVAPDIFRRHVIERDRIAPLPILVVQVFRDERNPADTTLHGDKLQLRKTIEYSAEDQIRHGVGIRHEAHAASDEKVGAQI